MAMLTLNGLVQNVFHTNASVDKKTGEAVPAKDRVQILAENVMLSGDKRMELVTLATDHAEAFKALLGRSVSVPVGVFTAGGAVQFYALKGDGVPVAR